MKGKRDATEAEVQKTLDFTKAAYPDTDLEKTKKARQEAIQEGYKDEKCLKCGTVYLAHHHFVRCNDPDCPMKTPGGKSLLDMLGE
jgi:hypothetical protein